MELSVSLYFFNAIFTRSNTLIKMQIFLGSKIPFLRCSIPRHTPWPWPEVLRLATNLAKFQPPEQWVVVSSTLWRLFTANYTTRTYNFPTREWSVHLCTVSLGIFSHPAGFCCLSSVCVTFINMFDTSSESDVPSIFNQK